MPETPHLRNLLRPSTPPPPPPPAILRFISSALFSSSASSASSRCRLVCDFAWEAACEASISGSASAPLEASGAGVGEGDAGADAAAEAGDSRDGDSAAFRVTWSRSDLMVLVDVAPGLTDACASGDEDACVFRPGVERFVFGLTGVGDGEAYSGDSCKSSSCRLASSSEASAGSATFPAFDLGLGRDAWTTGVGLPDGARRLAGLGLPCADGEGVSRLALPFEDLGSGVSTGFALLVLSPL